jgi:hypothetical protein
MSRRAVGAVLLAAAAAAHPALAQSTDAPAEPAGQPASPIVHYGKWGAAAMFVGFTAMGVIQHHQANTAFNDLQQYCLSSGACSLGVDGRYTNAIAEERYARVVAGDRAARTWLISGQVALAGTTALFVLELLRERGTRNIPFQGLIIAPSRGGTRLGWTLPFRSP